MEQDEKFENQLNLALDLSEEERERSKDLDAGYDKETDQWRSYFATQAHLIRSDGQTQRGSNR